MRLQVKMGYMKESAPRKRKGSAPSGEQILFIEQPQRRREVNISARGLFFLKVYLFPMAGFASFMKSATANNF